MNKNEDVRLEFEIMDKLSEAIEECKISEYESKLEEEDPLESLENLEAAEALLESMSSDSEYYEYKFNKKAFEEVKSIAKKLCALFRDGSVKIIFEPSILNTPPFLIIEITTFCVDFNNEKYQKFIDLTKNSLSVAIKGCKSPKDCWLNLFKIDIEFSVFNVEEQ